MYSYRGMWSDLFQAGRKPWCNPNLSSNEHVAEVVERCPTVGQSGTQISEKGGELKITSLENGPLLLTGNLTIMSGSGRKAWQGNKIALCRCGASMNKPFCDGAHVDAGFKSN